MTRRMIRLSSHQLSSQHPLGKCPRFNIGLSHCLLATANCLALVAAIVEDLWSNGISADWHLSRRMPKHSYIKMVPCHIASSSILEAYLVSLKFQPLESTSIYNLKRLLKHVFPRHCPVAPSPTEPRFPPWPTLVKLSGPGPGLHKPPRRNRLGKPRFGNTWKIWMKQKGCLAKLRKQQGEMSWNIQSIYLAEVSRDHVVL